MTYTYQHIGCPVLMGRGCVNEVGARVAGLGCKKVLVVHGKNTERLGLLARVANRLEEAGVGYVRFDGVLPDPPDTAVEEAALLARRESVDGIVAIGGGSSLDTAKAVNVLIHNPPPVSRYYGVPAHLEPGVPLVCIPTTAGTGSEVTRVTVITNTKAGGEKAVILHDALLPRLAIVDPELMAGMPSPLTAATGMDAFAHAAESMTGAGANPLVDAFDREAIRMIARSLPAAVADGKDMDAREEMAYAATVAGIAFTNTRVHLGHCIGHVLGAKYHIPHGVACALAISPVLRWSSAFVPEKVRMIGECLGRAIPRDASPEEIGRITADAVRTLTRQVKIPSMREFAVEWERLPELVPLVKEQLSFAARPGDISDERLLKLLQEAYED